MTAQKFSVGIVSYYSAPTLLRDTLSSLAIALSQANLQGIDFPTTVVLWDNVPHGDPTLVGLLEAIDWPSGVTPIYQQSPENLGFGRAHNAIFQAFPAEYHLILNPDVALDPQAIAVGFKYLAEHPTTLAVTPSAQGPDGQPQYLIKHYPKVFDLLLRGFFPSTLKRLFAKRLADYERQNDYQTGSPNQIAITSGCFLLLRRFAVLRTCGFDPRFFLYFEDFDLTWRLSRLQPNAPIIAYVPTMKIKHWGGNAGNKNRRHRWYFICSMYRFYAKHGWQWY